MKGPEPYELPTVSFIGGATQELIFHALFLGNNKPFDLAGCTASFSVEDHLDRDGEPILSKSMTIEKGDAEDGAAVDNLLKVTLTAAETVSWEGKYIYQVSVKDADGGVDIPSQGILFVHKNIHEGFIG